MLVLIYNVELRRADLEIGVLRPGRVEEFIGNIELKRIALAEPGVPLGAASVVLDALLADVLLGQGGGQQGNGLAQEAVKPLPGVIFPDNQFFQGFAPFPKFTMRRNCKKVKFFLEKREKSI